MSRKTKAYDKRIIAFGITHKVQMRKCLRCDKEFRSFGIYNRVCDGCYRMNCYVSAEYSRASIGGKND